MLINDRTLDLRTVPDSAGTEVLDRLFNALWREGFGARRLWPHGIAVVRLPGGRAAAAGVRGRLALDRLRTCAPYAVMVDGRFRRVTSAAEMAAELEALARVGDELRESESNMRVFIDVSRQRARKLFGDGGGLLQRVFADAEELDVAPEAFLEGWIAKGHPLHPGTKMRIGLSAEELRRYSPELGATVDVRFVALARTHCVSRRTPGDPVADFPWPDDVRAAMGALAETHVALAVHPWQAEHVLPRVFHQELADGTLRFLPLEKRTRPLVSVRTLVASDCPRDAFHLKLPVAVQMTSALRTVSAQSAENGPVLSAWLGPIIEALPGLTLQSERLGRHFWRPGAGSHDAEALEQARHLSMLLRDAPPREPGTWLVPAALLTETCPLSGNPVVHELLERSARTARDWMDAYATLFASALVPLLLRQGIAAEAHAQNTLVRFRDGLPVELILRDLGGIRAWQPWMEGAPALHPASVITAASVEELIAKAHHTWLQGHLAPLATALSDSDERALWGPVREAFDRAMQGEPHESEARPLFFARRIQVKALTRMRLGGRSHHYDFCEVDSPLA